MTKLRAPQIDTGINANQIVELDGTGKIPAETTGLLLASKLIDESLASNIVLQDDDELFVTIPGAGFYIINLYMVSEGPVPAAGLDFKFNFVSSGNISSSVLSRSDSSTNGGPTIDGIPYTVLTTGIGNFDGSLWIGSAEFTDVGVLNLQWAQQTSDAGTTTLFAGSYLSLQKV